ncbi:MAG: TlpA family protein disulfide reductase [Verrucomicrobia bacterium]|nr:TlpA family protein disulfide reductase [Verrucomicrobiota bacterium]
MYPHERSLVKRLEGRPFVLLGVNSDPKNRLRTVVKQQSITWRSWWDGGSTGGPIARQWGIRGWPTLVLIDHKGVIREKHVGSPGDEELDRELEQLIREAEAAQE